MITSGDMILLKMQYLALHGMIKKFLEFSYRKITVLPVKVKGLEFAGSRPCCVWNRLKCFEVC